MVDEIRNIKDNLLKVIAGIASAPVEDDGEEGGEGEGEDQGRRLNIDAQTARALLGAIFTRAGKGKDDVVRIVAREIGVAVAAMLKEPLAQLAKHQKLQISFEFVPKVPGSDEEEASDTDDDDDEHAQKKRRPKSRRAAK